MTRSLCQRELRRTGFLAATKCLQNSFASGGLVQDVEVDASNAAVEELLALIHGMLDTDLKLGVFVIFDGFQFAMKFRRKIRSAKFRDALNAGEVRDRHDSRYQRNVDADASVVFAEPKEIVVVEEQLCVNGVSAGVDFSLQVLQVGVCISGFLVLFRVASDADT